MDFDIGVPLPKSHIHNVFEPVNVIRVVMGKLRRKAKSPASGSTYKGIALPRGKARWVWMGLAVTAVAEVRMFWTRLRGIK